MADIRPSKSGWYGARLERYRAIHDAFTLQGNIASAQRYARHGIQYEDLWSDRRIAEYAAAIPQHILNRINDTKRLGRMALEGILPDHIRRDARKIIPAREGTYALRKHAGRLSTFSTKMLLAEMGWVDEKSLHAHVERFVLEGELDPAAWCALTLEGWMREKMT